ncbi:MAG: hypothetical protein AMJ93_15220 [Anaerolineae bacterium SM23_84]|nr:MAG: hypothetical protein AMJ93_15220 [Anaerolineae bacterium SM23_84]
MFISPTPRPLSLASPTPAQRPTYTLPPMTRDTPRAPADFGCLAFQLEPDTIWLLHRGDVPRPLTQGSLPVLSPDGDFLAFFRNFPTEVWIRDLRDSTETLLYVGRPLVYDMAWSPDGSMLAITNGAYAKHVPTGDLWRVDVPEGSVRQLAEEDGGSPHFSPDGRWIALVRTYWSPRVSLAIMRPDGAEHRLLFDDLLSQCLEWASDSSGFALALTRMGASAPSVRELWWVPTLGEPLQLGQLVDAGDVQWQPGAQRLLYAPLSQGEQAPLHLANHDGSGDVVVPGSQGMILRGLYIGEASGWSLEGRWFLAADRSGHYYLVDTDRLDVPWPLDVDIAYGWLDAGHYLAGYGGESYVALQCCVPHGPCEFLAHIAGRIAALSYVNDCGR